MYQSQNRCAFTPMYLTKASVYVNKAPLYITTTFSLDTRKFDNPYIGLCAVI